MGRATMSVIASSREIDQVFQEGRREARSEFIALIRRTPEGRGLEGRVAFIAGKRLGSAVLRNRAKRVLRESVRRTGGPWPGFDVALIARASTGATPWKKLDDSVLIALRKGGVVG